eukprot:scaffold896_cov233-Chaetoceros_neogracile.AAC.6
MRDKGRCECCKKGEPVVVRKDQYDHFAVLYLRTKNNGRLSRWGVDELLSLDSKRKRHPKSDLPATN